MRVLLELVRRRGQSEARVRGQCQPLRGRVIISDLQIIISVIVNTERENSGKFQHIFFYPEIGFIMYKIE